MNKYNEGTLSVPDNTWNVELDIHSCIFEQMDSYLLWIDMFVKDVLTKHECNCDFFYEYVAR